MASFLTTDPNKSQLRVLVTGGGSGIGVSIGQHFIDAGASVALHYNRMPPTASCAFSIQGDFSQTETPERVVKACIDAMGGLDILINNAAWDPGSNPLVTTDAAFIQKLLTVNVTAPLLCIRAAADALGANANGGSVINIGSIQSEHSLPGHSAYAASKGALDAMTRQLAVELGPRNIRVNSVNPGFIQIARTTEGKSEAELDKRAQRVPLRRLGLPEDLIGCIDMLCAPQSCYITGQILTIDGGSTRLLPTHIG